MSINDKDAITNVAAFVHGWLSRDLEDLDAGRRLDVAASLRALLARIEPHMLQAEHRAASPAAVELTDEMILQMRGEANGAFSRAFHDAKAIGCSEKQIYEICGGAWCETVRSYLFQAGVLSPSERLTSVSVERGR